MTCLPSTQPLTMTVRTQMQRATMQTGVEQALGLELQAAAKFQFQGFRVETAVSCANAFNGHTQPHQAKGVSQCQDKPGVLLTCT